MFYRFRDVSYSGVAEDSGLLERYALPTRKATYHSTRCNIPQHSDLQVCEFIYQYFNQFFSFTVDETEIALSNVQETTQNAP
jgi:hypothetical protein